MEDILVNLGKQLKRIRQKKGLSLKQVAEMSDVSTGLISKIENFRTTPSLPVLLKIMQSLQIDLSELNLTSRNAEPYILIRKGKGTLEERDDSQGLEYTFLFSNDLSESNLRTYIVKVNIGVYREPISTDAIELIYVINGKVNYIINEETLILEEGDILFFDGTAPHAVQNNYDTSASMLKMYMIQKQNY